MRIAIMQPYFFPYIGYYQLAQKVDLFIFFDDVNFIKKGYINRNTLFGKKGTYKFSIPVKKISQNKRINEHFTVGDNEKFYKTLNELYELSPYYETVLNLVKSSLGEGERCMSDVGINSISRVFQHLSKPFEFMRSSELNYDRSGNGESKILSICKEVGASTYYNSIGGMSMYSQNTFNAKDIELKFLKPNLREYQQFEGKDFEGGLSIIDVLMNNDKDKTFEMISEGIVVC